ncbi:amino-acid abc transporter binding protein [Aliivibrio fischeri ES114]|uniref:Amino-acid abc transporter binding protein n=1 Tax=Aliivibrio fischeri (strain ATCC 700601 / ES114) TaxID=312309 RepID=Q5E0U1_ALIF1|nr:lytic transglycosylase F [Aliivibrio fischeri]AAW87355.1 amino-acid abc transporter binding protein [Aliivibrio fischeri ES114]KLU78007.1 amino acid ABC transporter substrate-binding protein [Aliivibrio fischeri]MCE7577162.1 lytic transglycosylase F [Aliivibrio fischeri]MCE7589451.1 lytic transglycosylase F [Aliivibrio fischeri]
MDRLRRVFWVLLLLPQLAFAIELSPLTQTPYVGDLKELEKKGTIRVLVSADLGFYYIEKGQPKGIIAEFLHHFELHLRKNKIHVNVQVIPIPRDDLFTALERGFGDLAVANLTITPQRLQYVDFSDPVISNSQEWLVSSPSTPPLESLEDLSGKEVWVRPSSSYFESLQRINKQLSSQGISPINVQFLEENLQDYELMEMLNQDILPITVIDSHKSRLWTQVMKNITIYETLPIRENANIGWAMRKNSPELKTAVNKYIRTIRQGSFLGNVIYKKYLANTKWLKKAVDPETVKQFKSLATLFEQYADKYEFDWLMISAQAYQESKFNNRLVSHMGAVGIMQVLPKTAREPYINIKNFRELENNIHAGVKYMNFVHKRYFLKPEITEENQMYFSLAAYNAGPANVRKMRRMAVKHGYNPNIWFNNVEIMARKYVSKEPVHYVANISRYYVIYKQIAQLQTHREQRNASNYKLF